MDLPRPPQDQDLRNIIDKLAQFVARNGHEFENMTKNKQKDNPKFAFLHGGEYFNYYQYKVTTEQAILKQRGGGGPPPGINKPPPLMQQRPMLHHPPPHMQGPPSQPNSNPWMTNPNMINQPPPQMGHHLGPPPTHAPPPLMPPVHMPPGPPLNIPPSNAPIASVASSLDSLLSQQHKLQEQIQQSEQNLAAQQQVMAQQQQSQAEEAIRQAQEEKLCVMAEEVGIDCTELNNLLHPIISSCTKDAISQGKAWILGKSQSNSMSNPVIALQLLLRSTEQNAPFNQKLHIIYLINDVLHNCVRKNAEELRRDLEQVVVPMFCDASINISEDQMAKLNKLLSLWESKNNYFDSAIIEQLKNPQQSYANYRASLVTENSHVLAPITAQLQSTFEGYRSQHQAFVNHAHQQIKNLEQQIMQLEQQQQAATAMQMGGPDCRDPRMMNMPHQDLNFSQPPPGFVPLNVPPPGLPDLSKPPPGFPPQAPPIEPCRPEELIPSVPYFELPAGLMVSLVKLEDTPYKPLDPDEIRLPPPAPPSDRLVLAVEAFYGPPSHERPRDSEGWEKLGLYEYYRAKTTSQKAKEDDIMMGVREKSRSPSPLPRDKSKSKSPPRRRYQSPPPNNGQQMSDSNKESHENDTRRRSPPARNRRSRSTDRSPRSPGPSRARSRERSVTPPSFFGSSYGGAKQDQSLDENNKGHQLLKKMGWGGAGLGAMEQGIEQPISGGEVRDRVDQYKGVGINLNDPYENFRKSKAQSFITRMKARAAEETT